VIDSPGIPEKKSFPPRLLLALLLTMFAIGMTTGGILLEYRWAQIDPTDPRRQLADEILSDLRARMHRVVRSSRKTR
jgi:hypothetical protein